MNNVDVFMDTQRRIKREPELATRTAEAIAQTQVYEIDYHSDKNPCYSCEVSFEENLTLITAEREAKAGRKVAVLNFANAITPGGGVVRGARAQEEYLCRASNLYNCLLAGNAESYYRVHWEQRNKEMNPYMFLASDRVVYSAGVTVFRTDVGYEPNAACFPEQVYTDDWYRIDVLTCAAPNFYASENVLREAELRQLFESRIRNIFEVAIENEASVLILGAFGCGAFNNPPEVVAKAFRNVLQEERYLHAWERVIFTVKGTGRHCRNIQAFQSMVKSL